MGELSERLPNLLPVIGCTVLECEYLSMLIVKENAAIGNGDVAQHDGFGGLAFHNYIVWRWLQPA